MLRIHDTSLAAQNYPRRISVSVFGQQQRSAGTQVSIARIQMLLIHRSEVVFQFKTVSLYPEFQHGVAVIATALVRAKWAIARHHTHVARSIRCRAIIAEPYTAPGRIGTHNGENDQRRCKGLGLCSEMNRAQAAAILADMLKRINAAIGRASETREVYTFEASAMPYTFRSGMAPA